MIECLLPLLIIIVYNLFPDDCLASRSNRAPAVHACPSHARDCQHLRRMVVLVVVEEGMVALLLCCVKVGVAKIVARFADCWQKFIPITTLML